MHGCSWLPGIIEHSWNLASSHFVKFWQLQAWSTQSLVMFSSCQSTCLQSLLNVQVWSREPPISGDGWDWKGAPTFLPLTCSAPWTCSVWIVSQGFVESNSHFSIGWFWSSLTFRISHKDLPFGKLILPLAYRLPLVISPSPGTHPESTSYWPLSFPPSCFSFPAPDSPTIKESNPINRAFRVLITDNHLMYYPSQRNYPHLSCKAFIQRNEFF